MRSVRVRITVFAVAVFALAFAGAATLLVASVQRSLERDVRDRTALAISTVNDAVAGGESLEDAVRTLPEGGSVKVLSEAAPPGVGAGDPGERKFTRSIEAPPGEAGGPDVYIAYGTVTGPGGEPVPVISTSPLQGVRDSVDTLRNVLALGTPVLVALVALGVWVLVGRALRPVELLRAEVDEISHTTLDRRVHAPGSHDEVERLATTMNGMLDRLESASTEQRRFVSDASHELRTPLAVIRATVDVARRHPEAMTAEDALARISAATDRSEQLVEQLLTLARLDEQRPLTTVPVALDELVASTPVAPGIDVTFGPLARVDVDGDPELLRRAVDNLVVNATRHARSAVSVLLVAEGDRATIHVDDDGPGIPPEQRTAVFERFTRLDDARSGEGHGLGLAIVAATVERHGGRVSAEASPAGGARLTVTLPVVRSAAAPSGSGGGRQ